MKKNSISGIEDTNFFNRLVNVGDHYYQYDSNGNVTAEQDGKFDGEEPVTYHRITQEAENVYSTDYGWGLMKEKSSGRTSSSSNKYRRTYTWDERNQLISSVDSNYSVSYVYGQDGQRSNKYTDSSETLYFNNMWTLHTDSGNIVDGGQYAKNIYLGDTRIVTKLKGAKENTTHEETYKQYFYHSDHLGSASLITDYKGDEYQRIEYTPYGETWVEKTQNTGLEYLPYKFTGKEIDEETGLYYYGARYLDPKYSRWISVDPALGEYIPAAGKGNSENAGNLPGMGGIYNHINGDLYHYAGNNPVKYIDPTGMAAGEPFESPEDAAKDWAETYGDDSIYYMREYGSTIYSFTVGADKNGCGGDTRYSYNIPYSKLRGGVDAVDINEELLPGQTAVTAIHSHSDFDPNMKEDTPSTEDIENLKACGYEYEFLVTPLGNLKIFYASGITVTLRTDLPRDPVVDYGPSADMTEFNSRVHKDPFIDEYGRMNNK